MNDAFLSKVIFKLIPQFLSYIFHPLLMPTLGVYIILNSGTYISLMAPTAKNIILMVVFICTFFLPIVFLPLYYYKNIITTFEIQEKRERFIPLIITAALYYLSYYLLHRMRVPGIIQTFILACTIVICINLFVVARWKISAHTMGIGGIIGLIFFMSIQYSADMIFYLMISIVMAGLIGFARLSLNAHTPAQVYVGLATGFGATALMMLLF